MRSICGITSQPVDQTRVPSVLRSGIAWMCMRAPASSSGPADSDVRKRDGCGAARNAAFVFTSSSAASIAFRSPANFGLAAASSSLRVVQQFDTPPFGAGLTTLGRAAADRAAHSDRFARAVKVLVAGESAAETIPWSF